MHKVSDVRGIEMISRVKIRKVSIWDMVITVVVGLLFFVISFWGNKEFHVLQTTTERYIVCERAAKNLQDGSDYLTEQVRLFTMTGRQEYMNNYIQEAEVTRRREQALADLQTYFDGTHPFAALQTALDYSEELMNTEYYSMRLVLEANQTDASRWPTSIRAVDLTAQDQALSPAEKRLRAQQMVCDSAYQTARTEITAQVNDCMDSLIQQTRDQQGRATTIFSDMYLKLEVGIVVLVTLMLVMCMMVRHLVVSPLIKCIHSIQEGKTFPVEGAEEMQVLAETYNKVYLENQEAQMLIRHKAEHDALTDLLNRGSFERMLDLYENGDSPFALIIIDVDSFKTVNDTYGHTVGDEALKKVAGLLSCAFRSIDHICRIGGDEFAVIMVEMTSDLQYTIQEKIDAVNESLAQAEGKLPPLSLSVGVAFSDRENPTGTIFEDADAALYQRKAHGKAGCSFYTAPPKAD